MFGYGTIGIGSIPSRQRIIQHIHRRQGIALAVEKRVGIGSAPATGRVGDQGGFRVPIIDADAATFRRFFDHFDQVGEELLLSLGRQRPDHVPGSGRQRAGVAGRVGCLDDHYVFVISADALSQIITEVRNRTVPVGVIALADDVIVHFGFGKMIKIPFGDGPITAAINMDDDADVIVRRGRRPNAFDAGFNDACESLLLSGVIVWLWRIDNSHVALEHLDRRERHLYLRIGPEGAAGDLIADLHKVRRCTSVSKSRLAHAAGLFCFCGSAHQSE
jgi:hypothetical protein